MKKTETRVVETEASSVAEARDEIRACCTEGWHIGKEDVLQECLSSSVTAFAATEHEALEAARAQLPKNAIPGDHDVTQREETIARCTAAADRECAKKETSAALGQNEELLDIREVAPPRKGLLGIGKRQGEYEASIRKLPTISLSFTRPAKLRATLVRYPSLAESLREVSKQPVPQEWKTFGSDRVLFRLRYPSTWRLDASTQIRLIPVFSGRSRESFSIELMAVENDEGAQSRLKDHSADMADSPSFPNFSLISQERTRLHNCETSCLRCTYTKGGVAQATFAVMIVASDFAFSFVASGRADEMMQHRDALEKVLGSFCPYTSKTDYAKEDR